MKRAALYLPVSTVDQHPETQGLELRRFAAERGYQIVQEYVDHGVSGTKVRRPGLDQMLKDAHRHRFDVVLVWSCDRLARSTKHFLQVLDEPVSYTHLDVYKRQVLGSETHSRQFPPRRHSGRYQL